MSVYSKSELASVLGVQVSKKDVLPIVRASFPEWNGRKIRVKASESVRLHDLNWSGGTRSQYRACTINGASIEAKRDLNAPAPWDNQYEGAKCDIPQGIAIVEHSFFCGKDSGLRIHVNPLDMPKFLPAP